MNIVIVADPYVAVPPRKYGGTEQVIANLINGLTETGHEVILLAPGDSKVPCELIATTPRALGFARGRLGLSQHDSKVRKVVKNTEALLRQLLKKRHIDIINSHSYIDTGFDIRKFSEVPCVTTMHNPILFHQLDYYQNRSDQNFITISKNQQEALPDLNYVGVAYNGEDPGEFPILDTPEDYLCFLGRFDRQKNPHLAIMLAISLGISIKIAGKIDHWSDGYFEEEVEPYLSHPLVEYLGELNFEEKVQLLSRAKCNIHPTGFREPFGLTVIEAAYCGTPTIAINRGSMPELIEPGRTGVLIEDMIEAFHRIEECFRMDRLYIAKRARSLFNYRNMAEQYISAYETAIDRHQQLSLKERMLQGLNPHKKLQLEALWGSLSNTTGLPQGKQANKAQ